MKKYKTFKEDAAAIGGGASSIGNSVTGIAGVGQVVNNRTDQAEPPGRNLKNKKINNLLKVLLKRK